ncbi:C1 family peptidase [Dickeya poaceiphila]|uniref:Peptidase n=1 Tax=Dickeya poaceiphila TaxID=568768 RepID=A0A5B8I813_9GAMM|nr:C1 family peptidase [Dickeya poaceiphila]QDX30453.1 peptidase [Dickeya poaceiphila]
MLKPRRKSLLGYTPDHPDIRDHLYAPDPSVLKTLPSKVDLTPTFEVYDQGPIGSCTANALAGAVEFERLKIGEQPNFIPSRLFIYYNERAVEGSVKYDSGARIRDGIKVLHKLGVCPEEEWPYVATPAQGEGGEFPPGSPAATKPPARCYQDAQNYTITNYQRLHQDLSHLQGCLACGFPFVFGFMVYSSWMTLGDPPTVVPMPSGNDKLEGGHAVMCVGYDNATQLFKFRNSWGKDVGENGYFYMPYAYMLERRLVTDIWAINTVKN